MKLKPVLTKVLKKKLYAVMGKKNAKMELNKVYDSDPDLFNAGATELSWLMVWRRTPQGHLFWKDVNKKVFFL